MSAISHLFLLAIVTKPLVASRHSSDPTIGPMKDDRESEVSVSVKCGHSKVHFSQDLFRDIRSMVHSIPYVHRTGKNSSRTLSEKQMDAMRKRAKKKSADFDKRTWTKIEHGFICRRALEGARIKFQWHKDHFEVEEPLSEKIILQLDRSTEKMENRLLKELDRPTYVRVHWQNISLQTLKEFNVPWEWDKKVFHPLAILRTHPQA